ncbi:hypothetical protein B0H12DRAFT_1270026 [Mycena haematopus]|nr:hypothetical protein B0H12DRAFT_1270026 [Mycena haematopus]
MSHLEHADDMAIQHLDTFAHWCADNMLQANAAKSWVMIPIFRLNGKPINYRDHCRYVGITFQSTTRDIFASHYTNKASTARGTGHSVLGIETYIGDLPPKEGRLLGADIIVDVNDSGLALLEKVQTMLGPYSMRAPLFTELGLLPLRYRRLILALRYLGHYARAALYDSFDLYVAGAQGYWMDLVYALSKLPNPVTLPVLSVLTPDACTVLGKAVYSSAMRYLEGEILHSTRLYLLHGRREPLEDEAPKRITIFLRHYLTLVVNKDHRKALTRLLLSQHPLAVERMRYKSRYHRVEIPREYRRCRFGCPDVETVEHALFLCTAKPEVIQRRRQFVEKTASQEPRVRGISLNNSTTLLRALIFRRDTVCQIAKLAHQVFSSFDATPMVWPDICSS